MEGPKKGRRVRDRHSLGRAPVLLVSSNQRDLRRLKTTTVFIGWVTCLFLICLFRALGTGFIGEIVIIMAVFFALDGK